MNLDNLNSMTKYPSILTYHQLGERGKLEENIQVSFDDDEDVIITEKVDGTNARIIFFPDKESRASYDYVIGSREELLHAKGDRIWISTEGIVSTVKSHNIIQNVYRTIFNEPWPVANIWVVFGEVFGGSTGQAKQYTGNKKTGFRVFDMIMIPWYLASDMLFGKNWDRQKISAWRQNGGQEFLKHSNLLNLFDKNENVKLTPRLYVIKGKYIPKTRKDVLEWLRYYSKTQCMLDDGAKAKSEGFVIRNEDRSKIAKIRIEDYERTLGK